MQIHAAIQIAKFHVDNHMVESPARRPEPNRRVMTRFPQNDKGVVYMGRDREDLIEKISKELVKNK